MPQASTTPQAGFKIAPGALRIVLFGMPEAGKTSLLAALAQVAQSQEKALSGKLVDRSQLLAQLQQHLANGAPTGTEDEIVPIPVTFDTNAASQEMPARSQEIVLFDCDGRVANELMTRQTYLKADGQLAKALFAADTLILVVDAAANMAKLDRDFRQFDHFLELLEASRGQRNDVSGLPVFLVLTKCDLLAQPEDSLADWMDRIEERKHQVGTRFQEFVSRKAAGQARPFGGINLHVWATAVKRPVLAESASVPQEPLGVAELFRQCFQRARHFDDREINAGVRLQWTFLGSLAFLAVLAGLAAIFFQAQSATHFNPLLLKVDNFKYLDESQTPRMKQRNLENKIDELRSFQRDASFASLPADKKDYVRDQLEKLTTYQRAVKNYREKLRQIMQPQDATSDDQLHDIEDSLNMLQPPAGYEQDWYQTEAGRIRNQWLSDISVLRKAVVKMVQWYGTLAKEGKTIGERAKKEGLQKIAPLAETLLIRAEKPPLGHKQKQKNLPGAVTVTYATLQHFAPVVDARAEWEKIQRDVEVVRKLGKP